MKKQVIKEKESDIVRAVSEYLNYKGYFWWRNNSGGMKATNGHFIRFGAKGSPDIFVLTKGGVLISLECKTKIGKLSPDQLEWQRKCKELDAPYYIIRSVTDLPSAPFDGTTAMEGAH